MQKITPCLWFDMNAEEAINYYVGVFKNSKILHIDRYPDESLDEHFKGMSGKVINGEFELDGVKFTCLDGGPLFKFNESVSFVVDCKDQEEVYTGKSSQPYQNQSNVVGAKTSLELVGK